MELLKKVRDRIDWLDSQIAFLLNERMRAADQVGKIKQTDERLVHDPSRETEVLQQVETIVQHPILKADIARVYETIFRESKISQQFYRVPTCPFRRVGIVGIGLIGGSICKGLKTKDPSIEISALMHPSIDVREAKEGHWIDRVCETLEEFVCDVDIVLLSSPISTIVPHAEEIAKAVALDKKLIVADVASVKRMIVSAFEHLTCPNVEFVGTHPLSGKETSGFVSSQPTLFVGNPWVVVPHRHNTADCLEKIHSLIAFLGSNPVRLEPEVHDRWVALISHLPMVLSKGYFDFVNSIDPDSTTIAGPGFKSFCRLAHDNPQLREEILTWNQEFITEYLDQWVVQLQTMIEEIRR